MQPAVAQAPRLSADDPVAPAQLSSPASPISLNVPAVPPRMSPELALATYELRMRVQAERLAAYSDTTLMHAELTDTAQRAEYELKRSYSAPNTLEYTPVRFQGDSFVKSNVLLRLLQSEVDHVARQQGAETAIDRVNYKFNLKAVEDLGGHSCYVFQLKPRKKRVGLFKGRVFIDVRTGLLRRAEGTLVKSPSWWLKKVEFVQDFEDVDGFSMPVHLHSVTKARVVGRAVVDVFHRDYRANAAQSETRALGGAGAKSE